MLALPSTGSAHGSMFAASPQESSCSHPQHSLLAAASARSVQHSSFQQTDVLMYTVCRCDAVTGQVSNQSGECRPTTWLHASAGTVHGPV